MTQSHSFRLDILPAPQRRLWGELGQLGPGFVLYGGTAIALRLGHRQSEDFDFFTARPFTPSDLRRRFEFLAGAEEQQAAPNTLVCLLDRKGTVQASFFGGLDLNRVQDPDRAKNGLFVASLLDLAATKVKAVQDRASFKDYSDVSTLLQAGIGLPQALGAARAVYGPSFNPLMSLKALTFFEEGDLNRAPEAMRRQLQEAAHSVNVGEIPALKTKPGLTPEGAQ